MKVYFTRHEKTPYNNGQRDGITIDGTLIVQSWSDRSDNQITEDGRWKARKKGDYLSKENIRLIIHTGLGRTRETGENIAERLKGNVSIKEDTGLRDRSYGFWDGYSLKELETGPHKETRTSWLKAKREHNYTFNLPHARELFFNPAWYNIATPPESFKDFQNRITSELLKYRNIDEGILLIGHRDATQLEIALLVTEEIPEAEGISIETTMESLEVPNDAIYKLDTNQKLLERYDAQRNAWITLPLL